MKKVATFIAVLLVACLCCNVLAEHRANLRVTGELRTRAYSKAKELDPSYVKDFTFLNTRLQVDFDSELTDGVMVGVTAEGVGIWGDNSAPFISGSSDGEGDVPRAYVQMANMWNSAWSLSLGRQFLTPGTGFLISSAEREVSYDGITLAADYAPWTIELAGVNLRETLDLDEDLGMYMLDVDWAEGGAYTFGGYLIYLNDDSSVDYSPTSLGVRGSYTATEALGLRGELAYQIGDSGAMDKDALAVDVGATYDLNAQWMPQFKLNYLFASGDNNALDGDDKAFDPLAQYRYYGYALSPQLSNIHIINASVAVNPTEICKLALDYYHYKQDKKAAASIGNSLLTDPGISTTTNGLDKAIGDEVDLSLTYDYTEGVQAMLTLAYFMPDDAYNSDDEALEVRGELLVSF